MGDDVGITLLGTADQFLLLTGFGMEATPFMGHEGSNPSRSIENNWKFSICCS